MAEVEARFLARRGLPRRVLVLFVALACGASGEPIDVTAAEADRDARLAELRARMVSEQIQARGVSDERVLAAMRRVPRHLYVPDVPAEDAYQDRPHPIGHRQTISQPYVVAVMTELAEIREGSRVLEVGTGSGYQAAVLCEIAAEVYTIEIVDALAKRAAATLEQQGYTNVHVRSGDGYRGWPEAAPFDAIIVTAGAPRVPAPLLEQLAVGGRLVLPVDQPADWSMEKVQRLEVHRRTDDGFVREEHEAVRFVPMTGEVREEQE